MKFFFPDSQDFIDPSFDFITEERSLTRVRQRDDLYAHEAFSAPPFDGILVSRAVLDSGRFTIAQKHRFLRAGVREFFRLRDTDLETMGDCGAFTYAREQEPPYSVSELLDYYEHLGFDYGMSLDHIILGFNADDSKADPEWIRRRELTISLASDFFREHKSRNCRMKAVGVAQGWSPASYTKSVQELQQIGYDYIALGGMVPLKTNEILACLEAVDSVRLPGTKLHLLGITRLESAREFEGFGVASLDSTSPLRQAFKDLKDNYYTPNRTYSAIRVPQVEENPSLWRKIKAGLVNQREARRLEQACLALLMGFDKRQVAIEEVLENLREYERLYDGKADRTNINKEVLEDEPWKHCPCDICRQLGIHVILFRGAERNRRRGFHNVFVTYRRLHHELGRERKPETNAEPALQA